MPLEGNPIHIVPNNNDHWHRNIDIQLTDFERLFHRYLSLTKIYYKQFRRHFNMIARLFTEFYVEFQK